MPFINHITGDLHFKITYCGPALAGKLSCMQAIHKQIRPYQNVDIFPCNTAVDRMVKMTVAPVLSMKIENRKVLFDIVAATGTVIYRSTHHLALKNCDGIVMVYDSQWEMMEQNLDTRTMIKKLTDEIKLNLASFPCVIHHNKRDAANIAPVAYLDWLLNREKLCVSIPAVASQGIGVMSGLNEICRQVMTGYQSNR